MKMTPLGIKPTILRLVTQWLNQLHDCILFKVKCYLKETV